MRCYPCEWAAKFWNWATGDTFDSDIEKVRALTVKVCGFLPTAGTVAAIIAAKNPAVIGVVAIATAICNAVTKPAATLISSSPTVNGIVIEGEFVK